MGRKTIPISTCKKGAEASKKIQRGRAEKEFYSQTRNCFWCHKAIELKPHQQVCIKKKVKYCGAKCAALSRWHIKRVREGLPEPKRLGPWLSTLPFKELGKTSKQMINYHARTVYNSKFKKQICEICGYDIFVEVAHIKPINNFDKGSLFVEINCIHNLIGLCPNHHKEFDKGFISLAKIKSLVALRASRDLKLS